MLRKLYDEKICQIQDLKCEGYENSILKNFTNDT
jgi:hypothetical protein